MSFTFTQLSEAHRALASLLGKCDVTLAAGRLKPAQQTLMQRRIEALRVALSLIEQEEENQPTVEQIRGILSHVAKPNTTLEQEKAAVEEAFARGEL